MITVRTMEKADYPDVLALLNAQTGGSRTLEQYIQTIAEYPAHLEIERLVAFLPDGRFAGYGVAGADDEQAEHHFFVVIRVDEACRNQGAGTALLQALAGWARSRGAVCLEGTLRPDLAGELLGWCARRGFVTEGDVLRSVLKLDGWEPGALAASVTAAEKRGIRFVTLEELGAGEENLRRFHRLCNELHHDVPGRGPHLPYQYEAWREKITGSPAWDPSCVLLALDGEAWAALSFFEPQPDGSWYTYLTGVHRDHRGKGLGTAVKVAAVMLAARRGVPYVSTFNHVVNAPMLAINNQLGYQPDFTVRQINLPL
ncbi:MAG TPA: GNAT family N-acetyltransferase [Symbiobacteriaceae bacterium]|nr:GNAT family N-acetyltransferase [Symbiobacteriaceae bacterium]